MHTCVDIATYVVSNCSYFMDKILSNAVLFCLCIYTLNYISYSHIFNKHKVMRNYIRR